MIELSFNFKEFQVVGMFIFRHPLIKTCCRVGHSGTRRTATNLAPLERCKLSLPVRMTLASVLVCFASKLCLDSICFILLVDAERLTVALRVEVERLRIRETCSLQLDNLNRFICEAERVVGLRLGVGSIWRQIFIIVWKRSKMMSASHGRHRPLEIEDDHTKCKV